jgi:repressor LexA
MKMTAVGNKEVLAKNHNKYMDINNVDRMKVSQDLGIKYTTLTDWCKGNNYPHIDKIEMLANYFGVQKSDLIEDNSGSINSRLAHMEKNVVRIPLLGKVPAGMPFEAIEDVYTIDFEEVPASWTRDSNEYFALKISGDSMEPIYHDGDTVVFLKTPMCLSGQDCCVRINGSDATFKRVTIRDDGILLTPLNMENSSGFLPVFYSKEQVENMPIEILGVAKKLIKYL